MMTIPARIDRSRPLDDLVSGLPGTEPNGKPQP